MTPRRAKVAVASLALALALGLALVLGGKLFLRPQWEKPAPTAVPVPTRATTTADVRGILKSVGSDSMANLLALWANGFKKHHPHAKVHTESKGSSTAPPALARGSAHFGPMIRPMGREEIDLFERKFGYEPTAVKVALDVLAVYVHKDNPIEGLSLQELDAIFSKTRRGGHPVALDTWGDLGLRGEWERKPIRPHGRNSASIAYGYFKERALFRGDYRDDVREHPGSSAVVQAVASDKCAIGYTGIGYRIADLRAAPLTLSAMAGSPRFDLTIENASSTDYPLSRYLHLYFNKSPSRPLDPLRLEFLRFVLSREGQEAVVKDGFIPLTAGVLAGERAKLGGDLREGG